MRNLINILIIIFSISTSAQVNFNNAQVGVHGDVNFNSDITGSGSIQIFDDVLLAAGVISCDIEVILNDSNLSIFEQNCNQINSSEILDSEIPRSYKVYSMTGKFLMSGIMENGYDNELTIIKNKIHSRAEATYIIRIEGYKKAKKVFFKY